MSQHFNPPLVDVLWKIVKL